MFQKCFILISGTIVPATYHRSALLGNNHLFLPLFLPIFYHPLIEGCLFWPWPFPGTVHPGLQDKQQNYRAKTCTACSYCREFFLLSLVKMLLSKGHMWASIFIPWTDNVQDKSLLIVRQWVTDSEYRSEESWLDILQIINLVDKWLLGKGEPVRSETAVTETSVGIVEAQVWCWSTNTFVHYDIVLFIVLSSLEIDLSLTLSFPLHTAWQT